MSNFNNASLIVTPNGEKAGKLYSIVPTNGTGDLDVVRATTATYVGSDGLIKTAGINEPRLDYSNGSCPSILVEPQRTNLRTYSNDFSKGDWIKNSITITYNSEISPDGTLNASLISTGVDNSDLRHRLLQSYVYISGTTYTGSFFLKKANHRWIQICAVTGFLADVWANFDLENGVIGNTGGAGTTASIENYGDGWYRCSVTGVASSTGSFTGFEIVTTNNTNSGRYLSYKSLIAENVCYIWGAQLEVGSNATSYIPTTSSSVTRNADLISKTGISNLIGQTEGTLFADVYINSFSSTGVILSTCIDTTSVRIEIYKTTNGKINFDIIGNTGSLYGVSSTSTFTGNVRLKIALGYKSGDTVMFINGIQETTVRTSIYDLTGQNRVGLGQNRYNFYIFNDFINNALLFKTRLTNTELQQLTTL